MTYLELLDRDGFAQDVCPKFVAGNVDNIIPVCQIIQEERSLNLSDESNLVGQIPSFQKLLAEIVAASCKAQGFCVFNDGVNQDGYSEQAAREAKPSLK